MFERWRTSRLLHHLERLGPDSVEGKPARVTGVVRAGGELLVSPMHERECVAWRVRMRDGGDQSGRVRGTFVSSEQRPFRIEVPGLGLLDVDGEDIVIEVSALASGGLTRTGEPWRAFCESRGLSGGDAGRGPDTVDEAIVEPDVEVTLAGIAVRHAQGAAGGYRDGELRWALRGTFDLPIIVGAPLAP